MIEQRFPGIARHLPRIELCERPTPVDVNEIVVDGARVAVAVKRDDLTSPVYGGNKVRKLEYLLRRARDRGASRIATFGAIASNHATATSIFAHREGFDCIGLLSHQTRTPASARALNMHLKLGTRLVEYGGSRAQRIATLRKTLRGQETWVIPLGGTCWLSVVGVIDAALELAAQIESGQLVQPDELYVAMGTMGTVAGIATGLALAGLPTRVHAVRVTDELFASPCMLQRLISKTALLLRRMDSTVPEDLAERVNVNYRPEFFGRGYARATPESERAVALAVDQLGLTLENTYTGKAFAALLADRRTDAQTMFWNTYNSTPLPVDTRQPSDIAGGRIPESFLSYFD